MESLESRQLLAADIVAMGPALPEETHISAAFGESDSLAEPDFTRFESLEEFTEFVLREAEDRYKSQGNGRQVILPTFVVSSLFQRIDVTQSFDSAAFKSSISNNVQVANVDEADLIETDGRYVYSLSDRTLIIVDAADPHDLRTISVTELANHPTGMYLSGDRLVVTSQPAQDDPFVLGRTKAHASFVDVYDVSDKTTPAPLRSFAFDGMATSSRLVGSQLHVVLNNNNWIPNPKGSHYYGAIHDYWIGDSTESLEDYLAVVRESIPSLLPSYSTTDSAGHVTEEGRYVEVTDVYRPTSAETTSLRTIVRIDVAADMPSIERVAAIPSMSTSTVYMNQDSLYVAEQVSRTPIRGESSLRIQRFRLSDSAIELAGSTQINGQLLNQFAMDEHAGHLRVATTEWHEGEWVNRIRVLDIDSSELAVVGTTDPVAPGETIRSVRFDGDDAFVVTFRTIDPFFTIDLSSPASPQVVGELKIPGFSQHLVRLEDDLVLGLGLDGDGGGLNGNSQVSLYDVTDFSNPTEVDRFSFPSGVSISGSDHQRINYLTEHNLLAVPANSHGAVPATWPLIRSHFNNTEPTHSLYVFDVTRESGITLKTKVEHSTHVARSVAINNALLSVSQNEVVATVDEVETDRTVVRSTAVSDVYTFNRLEAWRLDPLTNDPLADESTGARIIDVTDQPGLNVTISEDGQSVTVDVNKEEVSANWQCDELCWSIDRSGAWASGQNPRSANYFLSYTLQDSEGTESTATITVFFEPEVYAENDSIFVSAETPVVIDVLNNDYSSTALQISDFDTTATRGTVEFVDGDSDSDSDAAYFLYTAPTTRVGTDSFRYSIVGSEGDAVWATVNVQLGDHNQVTEYSLEITDASGQPVTDVGVGERFNVNLYVQDIRQTMTPTGVFSAFADVIFNPEKVAVSGDITHGENYGAVQTGDIYSGLIDELGGLSGFEILGGEKVLVATIPFVALEDGSSRFDTNPADDEVQHPTLLYGENDPIPVGLVNYRGAELQITQSDGAVQNGTVQTRPIDSTAPSSVDTTNDGVTIEQSKLDRSPAPTAFATGSQRADVAQTSRPRRKLFPVSRRIDATDTLFAEVGQLETVKLRERLGRRTR